MLLVWRFVVAVLMRRISFVLNHHSFPCVSVLLHILRTFRMAQRVRYIVTFFMNETKCADGITTIKPLVPSGNWLGLRRCYSCDDIKTYRAKTGYEQWYSNGIVDEWICRNCFDRIFRIRHRITYKRKNSFVRVDVRANPRIGVCNLCRAVVPFDSKRTDLHHLKYNDDSPLKDTIELCIGCHLKEGWRDGVYVSNQWASYRFRWVTW